MNEVIEKLDISNMIYEINGIQVMLDSDLAKLYNCKNGTKEINQAVKNNLEKFPLRFSWILADEEWNNLRSKFLTSSSNNNYGGRRYNPRVFTEHGIYMLSTVLKTKSATQVSIAIMDAFVKMRHFIMDNKDVYKSLSNVNNILVEHDEKINFLFSKFDKKEELLLKDKPFSAYKLIIDILNTAKKNIIIVDNYADIFLLDLIKNIKSEVLLITKDSKRLSNFEIDKYNAEYHNLNVIRDNSFHDRFIVIDNKEIYLLGTSFNSLGEKISTFVKLEDKSLNAVLLKNINNIKKFNDK